MTNPFQHGSSGFPESNPTGSSSGLLPRRVSYASAASGNQADQTPQYLSHPGRTSVISHLLNSTDDSATDPSANTYYNRGRGDMQQNGAGWGGGGASGRSWSQSSQLPSFSKAFNLYMGHPATDMDSAAASHAQGRDFFVPSYLRGSSYVHTLQESHRAKLRAQRDSQNNGDQAAPSSTLPASASSTSLHSKPPPSHRGMNQFVVEKPPPFEEEHDVSPLPTKWNKEDKHVNLDVFADGLEIRYNGPRGHSEREHEAYSIRADHHMPPQCGVYYFEVTILAGKRDDTTIGIGFSTKTVSLTRPPGWEPESYGYHGDDGKVYVGHSSGKAYGPTFTSPDVIGCGVNFRTGNAFFTKNGVLLGTAFRDVKSKLYPSVGLKKAGEHIRVNFGQSPFTYDIDGMMNKEKERVQREIAKANTSNLAPPLTKETDLVQALVLQFLQHDGYVETARAFAGEIHDEKKALSIDPNAVVEGVNVKDDEHATKRQRIRRAVLEGDIDKALKHTNVFYPQVLKENEQVYFRLRCRKFIEMVRTAAEMRIVADGKKLNGHANTDIGTQEMDLDLNGLQNGNGVSEDQMDTEDGTDKPVGLDELDLDTLNYGQTLQAEFRHDPRREVTKALEDIYALLAYTNPLKQKDVAHLLDKKGRVAVAEELNSAILLSLGKSSRAALEEVYAQTSVLLEDLRENGGPGAFVSLQDVVDDIPKDQHF